MSDRREKIQADNGRRDIPGVHPERPKEIRIGGIVYPITFTSSGLASGTLGSISYSKCAITIDENMAPERIKQVVIHEIIHGIDIFIGASDRVTEQENIARTEAVFAFLRDERNRGLMAWIADEGGERS